MPTISPAWSSASRSLTLEPLTTTITGCSISKRASRSATVAPSGIATVARPLDPEGNRSLRIEYRWTSTFTSHYTTQATLYALPAARFCPLLRSISGGAYEARILPIVDIRARTVRKLS